MEFNGIHSHAEISIRNRADARLLIAKMAGKAQKSFERF
jgi:hypothetical protein